MGAPPGVASVVLLDEEAVGDGSTDAAPDGVRGEARAGVDAGAVAALAAVRELVERDPAGFFVVLVPPGLAKHVEDHEDLGEHGEARELLKELVGHLAPALARGFESGVGHRL